MSDGLLIYGANGYTGELVVRRAAALGLRPTLAGRSAAGVGALAGALGLPHHVLGLDDPAALAAALRGHAAVIHCAGPFSRTSRPMAEACLRARVHYLDITGEIAVFEALQRRDAAARAAGVMLLPGVGFDVVPSDCLAAHLKRRLPGATSLNLAFRVISRLSRGTATTAIEGIGTEGAVRRDGRIVRVPAAHATRRVDFGRGPVEVATIPWGDVSTAYHSTGIPNITVSMYFPPATLRLMRLSRRFTPLLATGPAQALLRGMVRRQPPGPSAEERERGLSLLWGEALDGAGGRVVSRMRTPEGYALTAASAVHIAAKVLAGEAKPGFQTPSSAFGPDLVLELDGVSREDLAGREGAAQGGGPMKAPEQPELEQPAAPEPPGEAQAAAEEAVAHLEDRIGAFTSYTLAADFLELREIYAGTLERIPAADWSRRTERRPNSWTLRQTLAHLAAVAETYNTVIRAGLEGRPVELPGMATRSDLRRANMAELAARTALSPAELSRSLLDALEAAAHLVAPLEAEHMGRKVSVPFFDGVPTVAELFGCSLSHAGIVHGAQIAPSRARPIWIFFQPGLMRRQLTRFFHNLGLAYWPERGGSLHATIAFHVAGQGGGSWYVRATPAGGEGRIGVARTNDLSFSFASADLLCRVFTFQTRPWRALLTRQLRLSGNLRLAQRLPRLFTPT